MSFEQSLRKNFWIVPLPLVAIAGLLNAQAVTQLIGIGISVDAAQLAQAPPVSTRDLPAKTSVRPVSARPILERNPFDHVTGSLLPPTSDDADGAPSEAVDTSDPWSAPTCEGVNVSVIVASDDEDWSFASLSGKDGKVHLLRRGGEVGAMKVHFIGRDRVWLSGDGALCQIRLRDAKTPAPAPAPPVASSAPAAAGRSRAAPLDPDLRKGIQAVSATEFNIDRGVVDKILENQAELMRQARVVPVQENGRVVGVRLSGIRPDALLGVLGMQNGDQLRTINGFDMGSPEKALEAYARLRTADRLTIQLNRGGKSINLDYNIK